MSAHNRKVGQCLGGIKSMADISLRCIVDEDDGCLLWQGAMSGRSPDAMQLPTARFNGAYRSLVRVAWELSNKPLLSTQIVWRTCTNKRCLEVAHMMCGTRSQYGKWLRDTGRNKGRITYVVANRVTGKSRQKVSHEQVLEIQISCEPARVLAERYGIAVGSVYRIIRKRHELATNASVFSWRPA